MFSTTDSAASRFGRDRDVFPDSPAPGPYEAPYDVRRGYQQPLRPTTRRREREATVLFMGREDEAE
ncbi:MAG TPA: hypothetical protein VM759_03880 [Longimicrobium sp.]|nr:hypothetical protein [Longimicrobium sp.]